MTGLVLAPQWAVDVLQSRKEPEPVPTGPGEPPVRLSEQDMRLWRGEVVVDKVDAKLKPAIEVAEADTSTTLYCIGSRLAKGGATASAIIHALAERGRSLGFDKYVDRPEEYSRIAAKVLEEAVSQPPARPSTELTTFTAADLSRLHLRPLRWILRGILAEGLTIIAGGPKVGKSTLVLLLALAVAGAGMPVLGFKPETTGDVLLLALEDGQRRLQSRVKEMLGNRPWPERLHFALSSPIFDADGTSVLEDWLYSHLGLVLVVVDVLEKVRPPQRARTNAYRDDYAALQPLAGVARKHGIAVVVVHHLRKGRGDDPLEALSGSMGLPGVADCIWTLKAQGDKQATLAIRGRDVEEQTVSLRFEYPFWHLITPELKHSPLQRKILALLRAEAPLMPSKIADRLRANRNSVYSALNRLADAGEVVNRGSGYVVANDRGHGA